MKSKVGKILCYTLAFLLVAQPTLLSANDFGGPSSPGAAPGDANSGGQGGGGPAGPNGTGNNLGGNIYLWDGSEFFAVTDIGLRGVFPIKITRHYNSRSTYDSPLGYGWDISYNERLYTYADGSAVIRWATGFKKRFVFSGGGYVSDDHFPGTLVQHGDGTFTFTSLKGMQRHFDLNGRLTRIEDYHGNSLRMSYTVSKQPLTGLSPFSIDSVTPQIVSYDYQLTRVEEWYVTGTFSGRYVDLAYDGPTGRLVTITDYAGRTIQYQHDEIGNLIRVDYPENLFKTHAYEDPHDKHNITAFGFSYGANNPVIHYTNEYDDQDRVIRQSHAGGTLEIEYTIPLTRTTVTKTVRDSENNVLHQFNNVLEFNDQGYLMKFIDAEGNLGEYIRDLKGNCIREVIWKNMGTPSSPNLVEDRTINFSYDSDRNLTSFAVTLDSGETITQQFTYDHGWLQTWSTSSTAEPGRISRAENIFDYRGIHPNHVAQRRVLVNNDGSPEYQAVMLAYNDMGQLGTVTYGNGEQENFTYTNGFLTNHDGTLFGRDEMGNITSVTDLNGNVTTYEYDLLDQLIKETNPMGEQAIVTYEGFNIVEIEHGKTASEAGRKFLYSYDPFGRPLSSSVELNGTPIIEESYGLDSDGNLMKFTDGVGQAVFLSYDTKNQLRSLTDPIGKSVTYDYDVLGNHIRTTDANGKIAEYAYDDLGRLIKMKNTAGNETSYAYNAQNLLKRITDARGKAVILSHDLSGGEIAYQQPLGQTEVYHYDAKGRMDFLVNADGQRIDYAYNSLDKVEAITIPGESPRTLSFDYDSEGNLLRYTDSAFSSTPMLSYTYDSLNRIETVTYHAIGVTLDYDYNRFDDVQKMTCKKGATELFSYSYAYEDALEPTSVTELPENMTTFINYDLAGRQKERHYPSGVKAVLTYNPNGFIDEIRYLKSDDSSFDFFQHEFSDVGYLTAITSKVGSSNFGYEETDQLISATYPAETGLSTEAYTYDATGNRLTSNPFSNWSYDDNDRLLGYGDHTFTYDSRGNQLTDATGGQIVTYAHDALNRLASVNAPGLTASYTYDQEDRRIRKEVGGEITWFIYDGDELLAEFDQNGTLLRRYIYDPTEYNPLGITDSTGHYDILSNHLGAPQYVVNENQVAIWQAGYQSFGEAAINSDPDNDGTMFISNLRYPNQYYDQETGLYYNIARYYNPRTGRYIEQDPIGGEIFDPLAMNPYPYVRNDPLGAIDPDGRLGLAGLIVVGSLLMIGISIWGLYYHGKAIMKFYDKFNKIIKAVIMKRKPQTAGTRKVLEEMLRSAWSFGNRLYDMFFEKGSKTLIKKGPKKEKKLKKRGNRASLHPSKVRYGKQTGFRPFTSYNGMGTLPGGGAQIAAAPPNSYGSDLMGSPSAYPEPWFGGIKPQTTLNGPIYFDVPDFGEQCLL